MKIDRQAMVGFLLVALTAGAFWFLALAPKREQASELGAKVERLASELETQQQAAAAAAQAKAAFAPDYQQLVLLGKAVPDGDDTPSLLVELNRISLRSGVSFRSIELNTSGAGEATTAPVAATPAPAAPLGDATATPASITVPATEVAAATLPIGATIGPAGLGVMPYKLSFRGGFFGVSNFIGGLDRLVRTKTSNVAVDGRLVTIDGFSLALGTESKRGPLNASFAVTTYVTPPGQGLTAGATSAAPPAVATPAAATTSTAVAP